MWLRYVVGMNGVYGSCVYVVFVQLVGNKRGMPEQECMGEAYFILISCVKVRIAINNENDIISWN